MYDPAHFRPSVLPLDIKQQILIQSDWSDLVPLLETGCEPHDLDLFFMHLREQDNQKGIHLHDYLPELAKQFDQ